MSKILGNHSLIIIIKQVHARYAGNGKYYPATICQIQDDKIVVNWIDNDSKYRDVELEHIETLSEKATSNIWIDAVVIGKVERDVENDDDDDDDDDDDTENYKVRVTVTENVKDDNPCVQVVPISEMRHPVPKESYRASDTTSKRYSVLLTSCDSSEISYWKRIVQSCDESSEENIHTRLGFESCKGENTI